MQQDVGRRNLGESLERIQYVLIDKKSHIPDEAEAHIATMAATRTLTFTPPPNKGWDSGGPHEMGRAERDYPQQGSVLSIR